MTRAVAAPTASLRTTGPPVPYALVGPTAVGKTAASLRLAERLDAEVVLIDSMTVYRGMDVGTAKPSADERARIAHHLVDVWDPSRPFSVAEFQRLGTEAMAASAARGKSVLLVGGSGLYYRSLVDDLEFPGTDAALRGELEIQARALGADRLYARLRDVDPAGAAKMERSNARRIVRALEVAALTGRGFSSFASAWDGYPEDRVRAAGVTMEPEALRRRIEARAGRLFREGLLEETERLLRSGAGRTATQAIGYAEAAEHLAGRLTREEALERIVRRTKALARRQMAWFRRDPRIRWFTAGDEGAAGLVDELEEYYRG